MTNTQEWLTGILILIAASIIAFLAFHVFGGI